MDLANSIYYVLVEFTYTTVMHLKGQTIPFLQEMNIKLKYPSTIHRP